MPDIHAKLSASGAKKWLNCPASVTLESRFPDTGSVYAAEGTTAHALGQAVNKGVRYPGFKVVEGRSNRRYAVPDAEIAAILTEKGYKEEEIYTKEILGISKMEALLSKKKFNEYLGGCVVKPQGKPTLVPVEDARPEINTAEKAAEDFKDIIEKE